VIFRAALLKNLARIPVVHKESTGAWQARAPDMPAQQLSSALTCYVLLSDGQVHLLVIGHL
jgi:hypothetical protein